MPKMSVKKMLYVNALWLSVGLAILFNLNWIGTASAADKYTIAVTTLMSHPALDSVQQGLKAELTAEGFVEGKNVDYIFQNANGQIQLAASIANDLSGRNPSVIVAITTPMAQAVVKAAKVPVVFAAVTDPVGAGLVLTLDKGEPAITGTSDAWPYNDQLKLIREDHACGHPTWRALQSWASQYGIQQIRKYAKERGLILIEAPANSPNDVYPVARGLVGRVDALFLSSDNTVISGMAGALQVARQNQIPLYVGDSGTVQKGGLAAVSVGYLALGHETGKLVGRMLRGVSSLWRSVTPLIFESWTLRISG